MKGPRGARPTLKGSSNYLSAVRSLFPTLLQSLLHKITYSDVRSVRQLTQSRQTQVQCDLALHGQPLLCGQSLRTCSPVYKL